MGRPSLAGGPLLPMTSDLTRTVRAVRVVTEVYPGGYTMYTDTRLRLVSYI